jgi:hypothetical protein
VDDVMNVNIKSIMSRMRDLPKLQLPPNATVTPRALPSSGQQYGFAEAKPSSRLPDLAVFRGASMKAVPK